MCSRRRPPTRVRRTATRTGLAAVALCGPLAVAPGPAAATDAAHCPVPTAYVHGTRFANTTLAPGLVLAEGKARDRAGVVDIHVLRADLTRVRAVPLVGALADRRPLTALARGRRSLVAAVNTGFFDFITGAPLGSVVVGGRPAVMAAEPDLVVGITRARRAQAGAVHLAGAVAVDGYGTQPLAALNHLVVPAGLSVFTQAWGQASDIDLPEEGVTRAVGRDGRLAPYAGGVTLVPPGGMLLVARGSEAVEWLREAPGRARVRVSADARTTGAPFVQAYGVGDVLLRRGVARRDFPCRSTHPQPARTAIGFSGGGRWLVVALVTDRPYARVHGLDQNQMASLMQQLGTSSAYAFDGSGSTELLARMPRGRGLTLRTYPSDGREREMPLGLGFVRG